MTMESFIKGFVVGSIAGAITGILFAPKSGKETRQEIYDSAEKMRKQIADTAEHQKDVYVEKKDKLKKALNAGVEVYKHENTADHDPA